MAVHLALAGVGEDDEFVRQVAADRAGVGAHRDRLQAEPREGAQVGDEHLVVGMARSGLIDVERVRVLHQEFAPAHQPEARPHLVAEFPLDVIEIERQILVRAHIGAHDLRDHLLVGRTVEHVALVPVLDAQHLLAVGLVAGALAPQVGRLDGRHQAARSRPSGSAPRARSGRSCRAPAGRAAGRRKCLRPPAASCRRAASAGARRFPPRAALRAGSAGNSGTGACRDSARWRRERRVKPERTRKHKSRQSLRVASAASLWRHGPMARGGCSLDQSRYRAACNTLRHSRMSSSAAIKLRPVP